MEEFSKAIAMYITELMVDHKRFREDVQIMRDSTSEGYHTALEEGFSETQVKMFEDFNLKFSHLQETMDEDMEESAYEFARLMSQYHAKVRSDSGKESA